MHTCMHACIHAYMHACIHTYIHTYIHIYIYIHVHLSECVCLCIMHEWFIFTFRALGVCVELNLTNGVKFHEKLADVKLNEEEQAKYGDSHSSIHKCSIQILT